MYCRIASIIAGLALSAVAAMAQTIQSYTHSTFIPGFNEFSTIWDRNESISQLGQRVVLNTVERADVTTSDYINNQASDLRNRFLTTGTHVLVAHSNGGLVARRAALTSTSGIAGIVTVATPHSGAPISDNSQAAISYVHSTASTVAGAGLNSIIGPLHAYLITQAVNAMFGNSFEQWLTNEFGTNTAGALDARTTSSTIAALSASDALPHASVYGTLPRRYAWMKVTASALNQDDQVDNWIRYYRRSARSLKACQVTGFFVIVSAWRAYYCRRGYKALVNVDKTWHYFTGGSSLAFDGFVPNSRTIYPGTTLANQAVNRAVQGANHNDIIYRVDGIIAISDQMAAIGMVRR